MTLRVLRLAIAEGGRGLFHFVADHADIDKVFVDEVQSLVAPIGRDVRLEVSFPEGFELRRVFGYEPRISHGRAVFELDDFNYGLTQVVMLKFEVERPLEWGAELDVDVELSWRDADSWKRCRSSQRASLSVVGQRAGDPVADPAVRKNYTIAVLAQGMREMAESCASKQLGAAERALGRAISFARERYPHAEDADIRRVLDMAQDYRRTLGNHVEGFRRN